MIEFSVESGFQKKLDWMKTFVHEECERLGLPCIPLRMAAARARYPDARADAAE